MITFYAIAALVTFAVVAALLMPLLRPRAAGSVSQQKLNAEVYREQLASLERERAAQALSPADYEAARDELHLRLVEDEKQVAAMSETRVQGGPASRRAAWAVALMVPLAAAGMYAVLGSPAAVDAQRAELAQKDEIVRMVDNLAAKLKSNPDNPKGWAMLARSYKVLGRMQEAEDAYSRVGPMMDADPDILVSYADLLASRTESLRGKPMELIRKALALQPNHPIGLMLLGTAAYREGDFPGAIQSWEKVLAQVEPGSADAQEIQADIDDARAKGGMPAGHPPISTAVANAGANAGPNAAPGAQGAAPNPEEMVARLAARLKANPDDPAGWARLARAYEVLGKPAEAQEAHKQQELAQTRAKTATR